jgi:hypothetical protein
MQFLTREYVTYAALIKSLRWNFLGRLFIIPHTRTYTHAYINTINLYVVHTVHYVRNDMSSSVHHFSLTILYCSYNTPTCFGRSSAQYSGSEGNFNYSLSMRTSWSFRNCASVWRLQFCSICLDRYLWLFYVSENLTDMIGPPEDGADKSRNTSEC